MASLSGAKCCLAMTILIAAINATIKPAPMAERIS